MLQFHVFFRKFMYQFGVKNLYRQWVRIFYEMNSISWNITNKKRPELKCEYETQCAYSFCVIAKLWDFSLYTVWMKFKLCPSFFGVCYRIKCMKWTAILTMSYILNLSMYTVPSDEIINNCCFNLSLLFMYSLQYLYQSAMHKEQMHITSIWFKST